MAKTATLSVRVSPRTRQVLAQSAATHDAAGVSALAREILERWADATQEAATRKGVDRAVSYLLAAGEWTDDPADFFKSDDA